MQFFLLKTLTFDIFFLKKWFFFPSELPDESHASNWTLSVEHCKQSTQSFYLYGNVDLNDPHPANQCSLFHHQTDVFWLGVARQTYISIDQGIYHILHWCICFTISRTYYTMDIYFKIIIKDHDQIVSVAILLSIEI